jgi:predicted nucleic acid-binding protein
MGSVLKSSRRLIDTNIIIDFLRGRSEAVSYFNSIPSNTELLISTITVTELFAGVANEREEEQLNEFLQRYQAIAVDQHLARKGGLIKNGYGPSHGIGIADSVIAATAIDKNAKLITLNLKHFPMVKKKESPY